MAHVCYKGNSDACHTAVILDGVRGNVQQPAHNLVLYRHSTERPTLRHQNTDATIRDVTARVTAPI